MSHSDKQRGAEKTAKIPIKVVPTETVLRKPEWIRIRLDDSAKIQQLKSKLRNLHLHTVCEEASCPNLGECFSGGTATFMIMGDICTRRCPFCDVAHGRPQPLNPEEPLQLARAVAEMNLRYVVITSVDRDDLRDGGAGHFANCISELRKSSPTLQIEILVPDFRGREEKALEILKETPPDVFNHNLETVPRLYPQARPGANYQGSLQLLKDFKAISPQTPTKSGLMVGLGETLEEVIDVMRDLRAHDCEMLTIGQYLQPSKHHLAVQRYLTPDEFQLLKETAEQLGFSKVASAPLVRSSYHAEQQAKGEF
jgi:lipoyl synthase